MATRRAPLWGRRAWADNNKFGSLGNVREAPRSPRMTTRSRTPAHATTSRRRRASAMRAPISRCHWSTWRRLRDPRGETPRVSHQPFPWRTSTRSRLARLGSPCRCRLRRDAGSGHDAAAVRGIGTARSPRVAAGRTADVQRRMWMLAAAVWVQLWRRGARLLGELSALQACADEAG